MRTLDGALVESGGGWVDPEAEGGGEAEAEAEAGAAAEAEAEAEGEAEPLCFEQGDVLGAAVLPCIDVAVREMKLRSRLTPPLHLPYLSPTSPRCAR